MLTRRGNWNDVWANPIVLSLSKDQRRKAKTGEAGSEPDMFGDGASVAAE